MWTPTPTHQFFCERFTNMWTSCDVCCLQKEFRLGVVGRWDIEWLVFRRLVCFFGLKNTLVKWWWHEKNSRSSSRGIYAIQTMKWLVSIKTHNDCKLHEWLMKSYDIVWSHFYNTTLIKTTCILSITCKLAQQLSQHTRYGGLQTEKKQQLKNGETWSKSMDLETTKDTSGYLRSVVSKQLFFRQAWWGNFCVAHKQLQPTPSSGIFICLLTWMIFQMMVVDIT